MIIIKKWTKKKIVVDFSIFPQLKPYKWGHIMLYMMAAIFILFENLKHIFINLLLLRGNYPTGSQLHIPLVHGLPNVNEITGRNNTNVLKLLTKLPAE